MKKLRNAFFCRTDKFIKYRTLPLKCDSSILGVYLVLGGKVRLVIVSLPPREVQHLAAFVNNLYCLTSWGTILGKVTGTVRSQSRNSQSIMEPQVSVSLSQENNTRLHSERDESRPQPSIPFSFRPISLLPSSTYNIPSGLYALGFPTKTLHAFTSHLSV